MIIDFDAQAKSDEELLGIWADQNNFIDEVVARVKAEIDRRKLDASSVRVPTPVEIDHAARLKVDTATARNCAWYLMAGSAFYLVWLFYSGFAWGLCVPGVVLFVVAVGVWKAGRWALLLGMILCALQAMACVAYVLLSGYAAMWGAKFSVLDVISIFWQLCYLVFSFIALPSLVSLWKRDARLETIVWVPVRDVEKTR